MYLFALKHNFTNTTTNLIQRRLRYATANAGHTGQMYAYQRRL